jgi:hypothetical protein
MAKKTGKGELLGKTEDTLKETNPPMVKGASTKPTVRRKRARKPKQVKNLLSRLTGADVTIAGGIAGAGTGLATHDQLTKLDELLGAHEKTLKTKAMDIGKKARGKAHHASNIYNEKHSKLPRLLKWYAKRKGVPSSIDLAKHVPKDIVEKEIPKLRMGGKAIRSTALKSGAKVGVGSMLALLLARSLSRKAEQSKKVKAITGVLDAKPVKLASADLEKEAWIGTGARIFGWGKNLLTRFGGRAVAGSDAALPHAGRVFQSAGSGAPAQAVTMSNRLKDALGNTRNALWSRGTGMKNVYRKIGPDGKPILDKAGKEVQFLSGKGRFRAPNDWEKVKRWDQTGGWINQGVKGLARHGTHGALGGYGLSWALNSDAKWNDQRRIDMALGGALLYPGLKWSNKPAAITATAAAMAPGSPVSHLGPKGWAAGKNLWDTKGYGKGDISHMKTLTNSLNTRQVKRDQVWKDKARSQNESARKAKATRLKLEAASKKAK